MSAGLAEGVVRLHNRRLLWIHESLISLNRFGAGRDSVL
jgi:hypothetical protein